MFEFLRGVPDVVGVGGYGVDEGGVGVAEDGECFAGVGVVGVVGVGA